MYMRFYVQFLDGDSWRFVKEGGKSPWVLAGSDKFSWIERGWTFSFDPPPAARRTRCAASCGSNGAGGKTKVVKRTHRYTSAGHPGTAEADPKDYSARKCKMTGPPNAAAAGVSSVRGPGSLALAGGAPVRGAVVVPLAALANGRPQRSHGRPVFSNALRWRLKPRPPLSTEACISGRVASSTRTTSSSVTFATCRHGSIPTRQQPSDFHMFPMPATIRWSSSASPMPRVGSSLRRRRRISPRSSPPRGCPARAPPTAGRTACGPRSSARARGRRTEPRRDRACGSRATRAAVSGASARPCGIRPTSHPFADASGGSGRHRSAGTDACPSRPPSARRDRRAARASGPSRAGAAASRSTRSACRRARRRRAARPRESCRPRAWVQYVRAVIWIGLLLLFFLVVPAVAAYQSGRYCACRPCRVLLGARVHASGWRWERAADASTGL